MKKENDKNQILKIPVGSMEANCYLVFDKNTKSTLIIDPGDAPEYIKEVIIKEKLIPEVIVATHGHFDHIMGVLDLQLSFNIPFLASNKDLFLIEKMADSAKYFLKIETGPAPKPTMNLKEGHKVTVGSIELLVLETPGHTPGSICLLNEKEEVLFTGDTIFKDGSVGRTDFSYSVKSDLDSSVKRILKLNGNIAILPGHGNSSTIDNEKRYYKS